MNDNQKKMIKLFQKLAPKYGTHKVFFDFVKMSAIAISNSFDMIHFEEREEKYMQIKKKYKESEMKVFHELFALLTHALEKRPRDILGEVYMNLEINNKAADQFFTPWHIAKLMVELSFSDKEKELSDKGKTTFYDPAIGGGVTLIALADVMRSAGYNYQTQLRAYCGDIDHDVLLIAYVQLSLLGIDAVCECRDALSNEKPSEVWFTTFYARNRAIEAHEEKQFDVLEKMKQVIQELRQNEPPEQLSLF